MELIDNINRLLGDDLKRALKPGARLKVAASCFSMYAFEALKEELEQVDELHSIFTSPTFMAEEVTDKIRKERKEFHIPKLMVAAQPDALVCHDVALRHEDRLLLLDIEERIGLHARDEEHALCPASTILSCQRQLS
jgi:hypothetical protein